MKDFAYFILNITQLFDVLLVYMIKIQSYLNDFLSVIIEHINLGVLSIAKGLVMGLCIYIVQNIMNIYFNIRLSTYWSCSAC